MMYEQRSLHWEVGKKMEEVPNNQHVTNVCELLPRT